MNLSALQPGRRTTSIGVLSERLRLLQTPLLGLVLFSLFAALMAYVQFGTPALADNDGYYHMKMGLIIREQGLKPEFPWLPLSILGPEQFYNHHMLYQVYLGLFAGDGSPAALIQGAKLAGVIMPALAFTAIWWLLRGMQLPWATVWTIGLFAVSEAFLYRMSQPRAQSAALLVLALALHWLIQRRYLRLVPLGFLFVWLYNAFPLLLIVAGAYAAAAFLTERRIAWQAVLYPMLGIIGGLLINPYFPENISFILSHILPKATDPTTTSVGNEWYPYQTWTLVENSGGALLAGLLGVFALGWRGRRFDRAQLTFFLLAVIFGTMLFRSRRFVEYFPPFVLIFSAATIGPLLAEWKTRIVAWIAEAPVQVRRAFHWALPIGLALVIGIGAAETLPRAREAMAGSRPAETYAAASAWLRDHAEPGSMIFQTDWDDFPRLFFYNSSNVYTIGLDPTYMELHDKQLYDLWVDITRGNVEQPGAIILDRFGAQYVITDHRHTAFIREARRDPQMQEVYRDDDAIIFRIEHRELQN